MPRHIHALFAAAILLCTGVGVASATSNQPTDQETPPATSSFSMVTESGEINFNGNATEHCIYESGGLKGRFLGPSGHWVNVSMAQSQGHVTVKIPSDKYKGTISSAQINDLGAFMISGTLDINGTADAFIFAGQCVPGTR